MQAILRSSLLLIAAASFAACGAKSDTANTQPDEVNTLPQAKEVEAIEEAAELNCDDAPLFADSPENCGYIANDRCYETAAEACTCAGCEADLCIMTASLPGRASCGQ